MQSLREIISKPETEFIMEAHDALSAKIVEKVGFAGIWGSGLTIAATNGYRDLNEISYSDVVKTIDDMVNNVEIPILVDIDTGYGDFNNAQLCARKLRKVGAQGISIEDKIFPKSNSYLNKSIHELVDVEKFKNKIEAIKFNLHDPEFCVVARTEAFIAGAGVDEALFRAEQYTLFGADAIFVHSNSNSIDEISKFMKLWDGIRPVIISPTSYDETNPRLYREIGISVVIWGNYMLRACINSMKKIGKMIYENETPILIKNDIATLKELFELQDMEEYYKLKRSIKAK